MELLPYRRSMAQGGDQRPKDPSRERRGAHVLNAHVPTVIHSDPFSVGIHIPILCSKTMKIRKSKVTCPRSYSI